MANPTSAHNFRLIVFDFDGTLTLAEEEGQPFRAGYLSDLASLVERPLADIEKIATHVEKELFANPTQYGWQYDDQIVALIPMGFCYPGAAASGDNPPRPECAPLWHDKLLAQVARDRLEIIIGTYAQARYIENRAKTLTQTVARWQDHLPERIVLPHPSPRNRHWLTKNPWFEAEMLPAVKTRVAQVLGR